MERYVRTNYFDLLPHDIILEFAYNIPWQNYYAFPYIQELNKLWNDNRFWKTLYHRDFSENEVLQNYRDKYLEHSINLYGLRKYPGIYDSYVSTNKLTKKYKRRFFGREQYFSFDINTVDPISYALLYSLIDKYYLLADYLISIHPKLQLKLSYHGIITNTILQDDFDPIDIIVDNDLLDSSSQLELLLIMNKALVIAAGRGELNIIRQLIERGASTDYNTEEPLREAILRNKPDVVQYFLDIRIHPIVSDKALLRLATTYNRAEILGILVERGMNIEELPVEERKKALKLLKL
jgi:hypothetical protein